jgi:hypothetical protein
VLLNVLRGDRAMFADFVQYAENGGYSRDDLDRECGGPPPQVTNIDMVDKWLHRIRGQKWSKRRAAGHLRYQTFLVEVAKESPKALWQRPPEIVAAEERVVAEGVPGLLLDVAKVATRDRQSQAQLLSAAVALAAERFRTEQRRWPASLDELVPHYLTAVPTDPFADAPLRFIRLSDGLVIYSVGADGAYDGGHISPKEGQPPPSDVGVRLWDVNRRRQPPPATPDVSKE